MKYSDALNEKSNKAPVTLDSHVCFQNWRKKFFYFTSVLKE